jgi:hypothetical protein
MMDEVTLHEQVYPIHVPVDKERMDKITKHLYGVSVNTTEVYMDGCDVEPCHMGSC